MARRELIRRTREMEPVRGEEFPAWPMRRAFDTLFQDFFRSVGFPHLGLMEEFGGMLPRMDMEETDDAFRITAEMPGVEEKDIDISVRGNTLTIRGEKREEWTEEKKGQTVCRECSYGSYNRQISLPMEVDMARINANYRKGVLHIELPKTSAAKEQVKKIEVH